MRLGLSTDPASKGEGDDEVVVLATFCAEGVAPVRSDVCPEAKQLVDKGLAIRDVLSDLEAALLKQHLDRGDEIALWNPDTGPLLYRGLPAGERHRYRVDARGLEQVHHGAAHSGRVDDQGSAARDSRKDPSNALDYSGIRRPKAGALAVPDVVMLLCLGEGWRRRPRGQRTWQHEAPSPRRSNRCGLRWRRRWHEIDGFDDNDRAPIATLPQVEADQKVTHVCAQHRRGGRRPARRP